MNKQQIMTNEEEYINDGPEPEPEPEPEPQPEPESEPDIFILGDFNEDNQITQEDVISSFSGVRPLIKSSNKDFHKSTRDFYLQKNKKLIAIFGGKWTTAPSTARKIVTIIENEEVS